jgi:hypothetical protein
MIRSARYHYRFVLLPRAPPRHGNPLSPTQFMAVTLTQMTPPTTLKLPSPTAMPRSCLSGCDD